MVRFASWVGAVALMAAVAGSSFAQEKSNFSETQKKEIEGLIRAYLLKNPEIINEMVDILQAKQEEERITKQKEVIAKHREELFNPSEGTVIGNVKGDVTVVEFFDYNCGYCKSMFPAMMETLREDGKIKLVLKELPILGPSSETAARAALASHKQGKYSEFHQALLGHKGALNDALIMTIAKDTGLNVEQLQKDMKDNSVRDVINRNRDLARDLQITGTPAVFVGEAFSPGAIDKEQLKALVADARK